MATRPLREPPPSFPQAPGPASPGFLKGLDAIHRGIVTVDKGINRVIPEEFNPFYYLGGITNLLWVLLVPTGIFLWFYYTPTQSDAYTSVAYLTNRVPFGALIRGLHRYGGDGMFIMAILHMLRNFFTDRYRGFRDVPWVSGVVLLLFTGFIGLTGYLLVWDQRALVVTQAVMAGLGSLNGIFAGLGTWFSRAFLGGDTPNNLTLARMFFLHVGPAVTVFVLLWVHYLRLHRPKIWPPAFVTLLVLGVVFLLSGLAPVETLAPASTPLTAGQSVPLDVFFLWPVSFLASLSPAVVLTIIAVITAGLLVLPWLPSRPRYVNTATVTPENCTGCQLCAIDCPFDAIVMVPGQNPNPRYKELAVVNDDKCAECGICVGACPFHAINLPLADENAIKEKVVALLQ
ncbi:MAG TPA: cytochrome b N-terminal domain-containing protein [Deinococcales bacterium]|nr:cytochrome b N-terminal domain-containing protein [Deinococcales bacterium]